MLVHANAREELAKWFQLLQSNHKGVSGLATESLVRRFVSHDDDVTWEPLCWEVGLRFLGTGSRAGEEAMKNGEICGEEAELREECDAPVEATLPGGFSVRSSSFHAQLPGQAALVVRPDGETLDCRVCWEISRRREQKVTPLENL